MPDFDIAVIGAGAAGLSVAAGAAQLGASVALIERGAMGGDCLNTGCVPSKALLAASRALRQVRAVERLGIRGPSDARADWASVRAHVQGVVAAIAPMDSEARYRALGVSVIRGEARFIDPESILVAGRRITARRFVIATGSRPVVPDVPGLDQISYWTHETLFDLPERPDHLLILGGGPIGLEMADAFNGLGCRVTLVEAGRILPREDPELAVGLRMMLAARGTVIRESTAVAAVASGPTLVLTDGSQIAGSHLLVAAGRRPDIAALAAEMGQIRVSPAGIVTDRGLRSLSNRRVFAAGDCANPESLGPRGFTHVAGYHAGIVLRRMLFRLPVRLNYAALPRVTYTDPELAQVGLTEDEAREAGLKPRVLRWPMADNDRAVAERDSAGLVKVVVSGQRVVGAGILAPHAGEMISQWTLAISQKTRLSALAGLIVPYPTRAEAGRRAAGSAFASTLFSSRVKALVRLLSHLP